MTLLSLRGYARWRKDRGLTGQSHPSVQRAIQSGRISAAVSRDGRRVQIDAEVADDEWARNTDAAQARGPGARPPEPQAELFPGSTTPVPTSSNGTGGAPVLARSQQVQALFRARLTQLEYDERSGKLCEVAGVQSEAFTVGRMVRDNLLQIPDRISSQLAAETSQVAVHKLLLGEITDALDSLTS